MNGAIAVVAKTVAEKAAWDFVASEKPSFQLIATHPSMYARSPPSFHRPLVLPVLLSVAAACPNISHLERLDRSRCLLHVTRTRKLLLASFFREVLELFGWGPPSHSEITQNSRVFSFS